MNLLQILQALQMQQQAMPRGGLLAPQPSPQGFGLLQLAGDVIQGPWGRKAIHPMGTEGAPVARGGGRGAPSAEVTQFQPRVPAPRGGGREVVQFPQRPTQPPPKGTLVYRGPKQPKPLDKSGHWEELGKGAWVWRDTKKP